MLPHFTSCCNGCETATSPWPTPLRCCGTCPIRIWGTLGLDHHRPLRTGWPEVVLGEGKTPDQIAGIVSAMTGRGHPVLVTRTQADAYAAVVAAVPNAEYRVMARCIVVPDGEGQYPQRDGVLIVTAGTADLPVAEEATVTAELMGCRVQRINDVGVAGLHRLLAQLESLRAGRIIVVVAGMEAALASVVAGLVSAPVIAVPTSVGYGASFQGVGGVAGDAQRLRPRGVGGEYRQRIRRWLPRRADQPDADGATGH